MRSRPAFGAALTVSLLSAATTWAALLAWRGFLVDSFAYLAPLGVTAVMIGAAGAVLRWLGSPSLLTLLVQLLVGVAMVSSELGGSPVPVGATAGELGRSLRQAMDSAQTYAAPIQADVPSVAPLLLVGGVFFLLLVDFLACSLRRVPIAGLALLAIYSVPAGLVKSGPSWVAFLLAAIGFLALLHLDNRDHLLRWGRPVGSDEHSPWGENNPVGDAMRVGAGRIGAVATVCALLIPPLVPVLNLDLLSIGPGQGNDNIQIRNPRTDLRRDLQRLDPVTMLRFHTDDPHPGYLRIAALDRFTGQEWSSGDRQVADEDTASGQPLPFPAGLNGQVPRTSYSYTFDATDEFDSTWLPTPFPAGSVDAAGDWRYDDDSLDFLAVPDDLTTKGLHWEATGLHLDYGTDGRFFQDSADGAVADEFLEVPGGLPSIVRSQAVSVTSGAEDDYQAALLLQDWFRERGGFRYSLKAAPQGIGGDAFADFLDENASDGRVGYCEQFASAMAVMARIVGIPARVAVGFLAPEDLGNGNYEYTSDDLHAWPELFFQGAGWVGFEPTPADVSGTPPDYTTVPVDLPSQGESSTGTTSASSSRTLREPQTATATETVVDDTATDASAGRGSGVDWVAVIVRVVIALAVLAVLVILALAPRVLRKRIRRRRLAGGAEDLWDELRATALDLALPWPEGRSPQEVGMVLVGHLGDRADTDRPERPRTGPEADPEATRALERIIGTLELARYARPGSATRPARLADDAQTCIASLEAGVTPRAGRRARWLPRSLWQRTTRAVVSDDDLVGV